MKKYIEPWKKVMITVLFFNIAILAASAYNIVLYAQTLANFSVANVILLVGFFNYFLLFLFSTIIIILIAKTMIGAYDPAKCAKAIMIIEPIQTFLYIIITIVTYFAIYPEQPPFVSANVLQSFLFPFNLSFFVIVTFEIISYAIFLPSALKK
ncbi:hypothetical protein [Mycoplasma sp. 2634B]|uniref:hypothetical protein n=1 Tax=Mycoplasma sp. 2634B TaxID=3401692 RepID=UPI003AAA5EC5